MPRDLLPELSLAEPGTGDEKNYQEGGKQEPNRNEDEVTQRARPIWDSKAIFCPEVWVVVPCVVQNSAVFHISSPIPCVRLHARTHHKCSQQIAGATAPTS